MTASTSASTTTVTQPTNVLKLRGAPDASLEEKKKLQKHLKERLAGAFRIFAELGYDEGVAGHISVRDVVNPHAFWVNPFSVAFDHICVSDLLLVDHDGKILEGGRPGFGQVVNAAGFAIHGSIHRTRPDIHAAAHSHSYYGRAFACLGRNIDLASYGQLLDVMNSTECPHNRPISRFPADAPEGAQYGNTVKLYENFGGVVLDDQEGVNICEALGAEGKGVILQNHGLLTAASSVDAAVAYFVRLENLCQAQLESDAAGGGAGGVLADADIDAVFGSYGSEDEAYRQAQELYEWIDEKTGGDYKN